MFISRKIRGDISEVTPELKTVTSSFWRSQKLNSLKFEKF